MGRGESSSSSNAFTEEALAIAASAAAPNTRRAYATVLPRLRRAFLRARHGEASVETVTMAAVAGWRDELTAHGLAPSTIAQRVSAVRRLAVALGADPLVAQVRCTHVQPRPPSPIVSSPRCSHAPTYA